MILKFFQPLKIDGLKSVRSRTLKVFRQNDYNYDTETKKEKKQSVHTLNGSSLALPRVLAGLLENFQGPDGIRIPKALVPYCGFENIQS